MSVRLPTIPPQLFQIPGGDHIDTRAVRSYLNKLEVTLKMGQRDIAAMKVIPKDVGSQDQPINNFNQQQKSCLTRNRMSAKIESKPDSLREGLQSQSGNGVSRLRNASLTSASECLLSENLHTGLLNLGKVTQRLNHNERPRVHEQIQSSSTSHKHKDYLNNLVIHQNKFNFSEMLQTKQRDKFPENVANQLKYIEHQVSFQNQQTFPSPASSLFDQLQYLNSGMADAEIDDTNTIAITSPSKCQLTPEIPMGDSLKKDINSNEMKPVGNRTNKEQQSRVKPTSSLHLRTRCENRSMELFNGKSSSVGSRTGISPGPTSIRNLSTRQGNAKSFMHSFRSRQSYRDIQYTTVTIGPNCSLDSLLAPAPCPKNVSKDIHHKSAWYHVPGRYTTPKKINPPKRLQRSPHIKFTETSLMVNGVKIGSGESPHTSDVSENNGRVSILHSQRFPSSVRQIWAESQTEKHHGIHPSSTVVTFKDPVTFS